MTERQVTCLYRWVNPSLPGWGVAGLSLSLKRSRIIPREASGCDVTSGGSRSFTVVVFFLFFFFHFPLSADRLKLTTQSPAPPFSTLYFVLTSLLFFYDPSHVQPVDSGNHGNLNLFTLETMATSPRDHMNPDRIFFTEQ